MNPKYIKHLIYYCGNYKKTEVILLIYDNKTKKIASSFLNFFLKNNIKFKLIKIKESKYHGKNIGSKALKKMLISDLILCLTSRSYAHSDERLKCEKLGKRFLSLPNYDSKLFNEKAILFPYKKFSKVAKKIQKKLDYGKKIKIFTKNGTFLIADIKKRISNFCPGYVDKNIKLGSPPDGETNISPNEFKSNGKIVLDGSVSLEKIGKLNSKIILIIKKGMIFSSFSKDKVLLKKFNQLFLKQNIKRRILAEIGFGFNKKSYLTGHMLCDEGAFGHLHFGFGSNYTVGGKNKINFHVDMIIKEPEVYIDNKLILKNYKYF